MPARAARWTIEQVVAVAPNPARYAAAEAMAVPARWVALGADQRVVWGRCRGSGPEPYDTVVDHLEVAWRCSCPSRSQPCKHALALLVMWVRGQVPDSVAPPGVATWSDGRARRSERPAAELPAAHGDRSPPAAEVPADAPDEPEPAAPRDDRDATRDERMARLREGLIELDRWLDDRVRTGLADPSLSRYATWDTLAARLVDARAGALANRVRRLAGVVGTRADWHEHVLAEIGILHLLAQAGQRLPDLPPTLADAVAMASGWQVRQADVLAGVPDSDTWFVAGRSDTREDRIEVRRVWLWGTTSRAWAMVLSFAAYRQRLDPSLRVGAAFSGDLHRYPGRSLRALVGMHADIADGDRPAAVLPGGTIVEMCASIGIALAAEPWADRVPATVRATPTVTGDRWVLTDGSGSLAVAPDAPGLPTLVAASAGAPVTVTIEWTSTGAVPLTVHLADRALDIGPRADPSFVEAA
jgi:hypothetical protein